MSPISVFWCLWIIFLNSLRCYGEIEHYKLISIPKIHSTYKQRSLFNHKRVSEETDGRNNVFSNILTNVSENQLKFKLNNKKPTYLKNNKLKRTYRFKRNINNKTDVIIDAKNVTSVRRIVEPVSDNVTSLDIHVSGVFDTLARTEPSEVNKERALARVYIYSNIEEIDSNQHTRPSELMEHTMVSNAHLWIKEDHLSEVASTANFNESLPRSENETFIALLEQFKRLYPTKLWKDNGWYEDDFLYIINPHWLQFPPPSKTSHYTLAGVYVFVLTAGIIGNVLVIFMFFKCRSLRTAANILVVNLAASDLLMTSKVPLLIYNSVFLGPALGQTACNVYGFIGGLSGTVSIGTLAAIAFDRYSVVVYPLEPLRSITGLRAKLSVVLVWLYGGFFAIIPALDIGLGRYVPEGYLTSCSFDYLSDDVNHKIFIFAFFLAAWVLPFAIIFFCYSKILRVVIATRHIGRKVTGSISSRHCKEQEKRKVEVKLAGIVICVIGLFFAAWTPYSIVSLLGIAGQKHLLKPIVSMVPAMCAKLASCIDPFIYVLTHPKFRQECQNLLLSKKAQRQKSMIRQGWSADHLNQKTTMREQEFTSDDGVEVVEMGDVRYNKRQLSIEQTSGTSVRRGLGHTVIPALGSIKTICTHIVAKGIDASELPKSTEGNEDLKPPSSYVKPKFMQRPNSLKKVVQKIQRMASEDSLAT